MGARIAAAVGTALLIGVALLLVDPGQAPDPATIPHPTVPVPQTTTSGVAATATSIPSWLPSGAVVVEPGEDLQAVVDANSEGTTFYLLAGRHVTDRESHVVPKPANSFIGEEGAILDGGGIAKYAFVDDEARAPNVTIEGLIIENYDSPVQRGAIDGGASGWRVLRNEIRLNSAAGINLWAPNMVIERNYVHHNEQIGVKVQDAHDSRIVGNEISHNNPNDAYDPAWEAGGTKFLRSTGLYIADNHVHDNRGPGLWADHDNHDVIYERNTVVDNTGPGIFHEISGSAEIRGNVVSGNAHDFYLGGILVSNSSDVTVTDNTLSGNNGGIVGLQNDRSPDTTNLTVTNNNVSWSRGVTGIVYQGGTDIRALGNIRFDENSYASGASRPFSWGNGAITFARWQAVGQDPNSTFG